MFFPLTGVIVELEVAPSRECQRAWTSLADLRGQVRPLSVIDQSTQQGNFKLKKLKWIKMLMYTCTNICRFKMLHIYYHTWMSGPDQKLRLIKGTNKCQNFKKGTLFNCISSHWTTKLLYYYCNEYYALLQLYRLSTMSQQTFDWINLD